MCILLKITIPNMPIYIVTMRASRTNKEVKIMAKNPMEAKLKAVQMVKWNDRAVYCKVEEIASEAEVYRYE
jgi:hypothetical protein